MVYLKNLDPFACKIGVLLKYNKKIVKSNLKGVKNHFEYRMQTNL